MGKKLVQKHGRKLVVAVGALAAVMTAAAGTHKTTEKLQKCDGTERWMVKTMQDDAADRIHLDQSKTISLEDLIATPRDSNWSSDESSPRYDDEYKVYTVTGEIPFVKIQTDGDIHIELSDGKTPPHTLVAEIPNPACPNVKHSPYANVFKKVRNEFLAKYQDKSVYSKGTFELTGVLFFDKRNHGKGGNDNGVELHPVIGLKKITNQ